MAIQPSSPKIFGIGLSRTGTTSLTDALSMLGYQAVHFPLDDASLREFSQYLLHPTSTLHLTSLASVDALTDTPVSATYRALDAAYPSSRFILTVRDRASWLGSCRRYWAERLTPNLASAPPEWAEYINLVNRSVYGTAAYDAVRFADAYTQHVARARRYFAERPDVYLELDICGGQGWEALCGFLGVEVPQRPFPFANALAPPAA
jgi:hypothetical protein